MGNEIFLAIGLCIGFCFILTALIEIGKLLEKINDKLDEMLKEQERTRTDVTNACYYSKLPKYGEKC